MSSVRPLLRALVSVSLLIVVPLAAARAADPADVASRLKEVFASRGTDIQWKAISGDDASMVLSGVTVGALGQDKRAPIGDVTLANISEDKGTYVIGEMALPDYSVEEHGTAISLTSVSVSGLRLPPPDSTDPMDSLLMYDKAGIGDVSVKREGKQVFHLADFHVDITRPQGDDPLKFDATAESFAADISETGDPVTDEAIRALGYEHVEGSFAASGDWTPRTGAGALDSLRLTVKDAGTLDIGARIGGLTPETARSLQAIRGNIARAPRGEKRRPITALGALVEQLTFVGASISFQDDSLTGKILDYVAAEQGVDRAQIVARAKQTLPLALITLNDPEAAVEAAGALSAFLDNPKNLTIRAEPPNPVPLRDIIGGSMLALPQILGLKIEANQ
jgi:hypothetical protein